MRIPYLDLSVTDSHLKKQLLNAVNNVLSHGRIILGPEVSELERKVAAHCNRNYAIGVSSGTDALYMAIRALGISPGDEIITTPLSWISTLNAIVLAGATPVFVDIDNDLNINAKLVKARVTSRTKAILPVHFTGRMCDMDVIEGVAKQYNLFVIEDAAQAIGATYKGKKAGSFGDISCFSMNSMKVFHSYGEAGIVLTDDEGIRDRLLSLRYSGTINREDCHYPSLNFRIHTIQAAMLLVEYQRFENIIKRRREIATLYNGWLTGIVQCPVEDANRNDIYYSYTIKTERRDALSAHLFDLGVETKVNHATLMPYHTAYKNQFSPDIPIAERTVSTILSLPIHEKMTDEAVKYVSDGIKAYFEIKA